MTSENVGAGRLVRISIVLPKDLYDAIESERGLIKRSTYIADVLSRVIPAKKG